MSADRHLPRPALRRRIEQTLAAAPDGITTRELGAALAHRARALGEYPAGPHQVLRQLGQLLVEGCIDERAGVWVLVDAQRSVLAPGARHRAA